ncbi:MAG: hypothetical protein NXI10_02900 [bacterium]|nr:hypothetical protein [bacterium]
MKIIIALSAVLLVFGAQAQKKKKDQEPLNLNNVVIIGQMDDPADRYSVEISMTELFANAGIKSKASLNIIKQGGDSQALASDSVGTTLKSEGFDTYMIISVRGYDKRFKTSNTEESFSDALSRGNLFSIYQEGVVSVSFEYKFFRNGKLVRSEIIKCGNASSRQKVMRKLRKKVTKRIEKDW